MKSHIVLVAILSSTFGCVTDTPTTPDGLTPEFAVAGSSGCYTVSGTIQQTGMTGSFTGTISGDVVGTVTTQTQVTASQGSVNLGTGQQTWQITGGIIEPLIGSTVRLELRTMSVFAQLPLVQLNNSADIIEGAAMGSLTYHGTLDVSSVPFTPTVEYQGVICL